MAVFDGEREVGTKGEQVRWDYSTSVRGPAAASGLPMETVFLCFQLRSLDPSRFSSAPAGRASVAILRQEEDSVRHCLGW